MNIEILRDYCLSLPATTESFPFDNETLVFKVAGKMFCIIGLNNPDHCNLKCTPEKSALLRQEFEAVKPGFHMNKLHWNTVTFNLDMNDKHVLDLVKLSYDLVVKKLTLKVRKEFNL